MKHAQPDHNTLALEQRRCEMSEAAALRSILNRADLDGTGTINWEEFRRVASDHRVSSVLEVMGLDIKDTSLRARLLVSGSIRVLLRRSGV